jgi:hypothetical protein
MCLLDSYLKFANLHEQTDEIRPAIELALAVGEC